MNRHLGMTVSIVAATLCFLLFNNFTSPNFSQTHYVDSPTQLMDAIQQLQPGNERIVIRGDGNYGYLNLQNSICQFSQLASIEVQEGTKAVFERVRFKNCQHIRINGFIIRPQSAVRAVSVEGGEQVEVVNSDIAFANSNHDWSKSTWNSKTHVGIYATRSGQSHLFERNHIHTVKHGIEAWSPSTVIRRNHIDQFTGRGIRVFGDHSTVDVNTITNNYQTNGNNVAIQTFTKLNGQVGAGTITGLVIWGNLVIESTDPYKNFPGKLQGITGFDGIYKNMIVAQNVVAVDHWHGIVFFGLDSSNIQYNTVLDISPTSGGKPRIKVANHKNGTPNVNTRVRYNISELIKNEGAFDAYQNIDIDPPDYPNYFEDLNNHNYRLRSSVPSDRGAAHGMMAIATSLETMAKRVGLDIGTSMNRQACDATPINPYCDLVSDEFNMITVGNLIKWEHLRAGGENSYDFAGADRMIGFAGSRGMKVHGHTLLWNVANPGWLEPYRHNSNALKSLLQDHIQTVVSRYRASHPGVVKYWDVVNEPFYSSSGVLQRPEHYIWAGIDSHISDHEYIRLAFEEAHAADPDAHLIINDYRIISGDKADGMFDLVSNLRSQGVPIHGVGFQEHYDVSDGSGWIPHSVSEIRTAIQRYEAIGVAVHITEMDVRATAPLSLAEIQKAEDAYHNTVKACVLEPNCVSFTVWDASTEYSWINSWFEGYESLLPYDSEFKRQKYYWILHGALR